jgi:hypothetical protein
MSTETTEQLGRFGHHPDPAIDFCVEVEELEGLAYNHSVGFFPDPGLAERIDRALEFRVGGDPDCVAAKAALRKARELVQS